MLKEEGNGHSFMIFATNQMKGVLMLVLKVFLIARRCYHRDAVISIESKGYALPIRCKQSNMVLMLMSMLMWIALVVMITERCSAQVCSPARPCLVLPI